MNTFTIAEGERLARRLIAHPVHVSASWNTAVATAVGGTKHLRLRFPDSGPLRVRKRRGRWVVYSSTGRIMP